MSFNVVAAWPLGIVCVSDRRLVDLRSCNIQTNRSTKMTVFGCADAHGVIAYNGIGTDDAGLTPGDWLIELEEKKRIFGCGLLDLLDGIRGDLATRLRIFRSKHGSKAARHTFVCSVWHQGTSIIYGISNYERVDDKNEASEGSEEVALSVWPPKPKAEVRVVATGMYTRFAHADCRAISAATKENATKRVIALCVKAVKNAAYGAGKGKGTVGASAQWALLGANREEVWYGMDVVGGALAQELPNLINIAAEVPLAGTLRARIGGPGILMKDTYVGDESASSLGKYDPARKVFSFSEPACGICGVPRPAAHRFCEVCLYEESRKRHDRSTKRRRE